MLRVCGEPRGRRRLDDLARVHDRDPVCELEQQRQVVRDEEHGEPKLALERLDLLQDLALHDDVERGRRLVHDDQLGLERERHRDDHALAHAARELVRVGAHAPPVDADELEQLTGLAQARTPIRSCARIMSTNWSPTRMTGLSAFIALWNTIETLRQRKRRSSSSLLPTRSSPRKRMLPPATCAGGRRICITAFATVVLPQPDSPARPTISPGADLEIDAVDGADAAVVDGEPAQLEQRHLSVRVAVTVGGSIRLVMLAPSDARRSAAAASGAVVAAARCAGAGC